MAEPTQNPFATNVTRTVHRTSYPAIAATRPELIQAGKTVLITGGTAGIGFAIAKAFIAASISTVVITGRRQEQLAKAVASLTDLAAAAGHGGKIIGERSDAADPASIDALWASLAERGVIVDVLVLNVAKFATPKPLFELGIEHVWESFEVNVRGPLHHAERFYKQVGAGGRPKSLINITTQSINCSNKEYLSLAAERAEYGLSKASGTLAIQYVAQEVDPADMQVVSFHPGVIYTEAWSNMGVPEDFMPFDDVDLAGNYAVWAASPEARFLHGRFTWASWDVDELREGEIKARLEREVDFLRVGVCGLKGANLA